jgi:hypothetical protein
MEGKKNGPVRRNLRFLNDATNQSTNTESHAKNSYDMKRLNAFEYYDSPIESYERDFAEVLKPYKGFNEFIKANYSGLEYSRKKGDLVGIELGGPGVKLFDGFEWDTFSKTAGFTLKKLPEHVGDLNHEVIEADVFSKQKKGKRSWVKVIDWVRKNGQPDFIIERMVGPLFEIREPKLFLLILDRWYRILAPNGSMFIEVPKKINGLNFVELGKFIDKVKERNPSLTLKYAIGQESGALVIYLRKPKSTLKDFSIVG